MKSSTATVKHLEEARLVYKEIQAEIGDFEKEQLEDVGFLTSMLIVLLGNYAQTGPADLC